jgi:hypothetical protein
MVDKFIKIDLTEKSRKLLNELIGRYDREEVFKSIDKVFELQAAKLAGYISKNFLSGQRLYRISGNLARSVIGRGIRIGGIPAVQVGIFRGPALAYAGVQELGTKKYNPDSPYNTILPKAPRKALAVPKTPLAARAGSPLKYPGELHFIPFRKSGIAVGALLDDKQYNKLQHGLTLREAKIAYLLLRKTDIKPKFYMKDGMSQYLPRIAAALEVHLHAFLAGKGVKK